MVNLTSQNGKIKMNIQMGCAEEIAKPVLSGIDLAIGNFTYEIMEEDIVINLITEGGTEK
jgi:hypothetical protein